MDYVACRNRIRAIYKKGKKCPEQKLTSYFRTQFNHPETKTAMWNAAIAKDPEFFIFTLKCVRYFGKKYIVQTLRAILLTEDAKHVMPIQTALVQCPKCTRAICKTVKKIKRKKRTEFIKELKFTKNSDNVSITDLHDRWDVKSKQYFLKLK